MKTSRSLPVFLMESSAASVASLRLDGVKRNCLRLDRGDGEIQVARRLADERHDGIRRDENRDAVPFIEAVDDGDDGVLRGIPDASAIDLVAHAVGAVPDDGDVAPRGAEQGAEAAVPGEAGHRLRKGERDQQHQQRAHEPEEKILHPHLGRGLLLREPQEPDGAEWHPDRLPARHEVQHQRQDRRAAARKRGARRSSGGSEGFLTADTR